MKPASYFLRKDIIRHCWTLLVISLGVLRFLPSSLLAQTFLPSTNDLWDISQGTVVTATSGLDPGSDGRDMFGGDFSGPPSEPGRTIFADGRPPGFVHYIQWQTPAPVAVGAFALFANGDGPTTSFPAQREFAQFVLKAKSSPLATNYDLTLYTLVVTNHPYTLVDVADQALLVTNIVPVTAQYFRAEFTQYDAGNGYDGPRILELDGYASLMPMITSQPVSQTVTVGGTASFSVGAGGLAAFGYQWQLNGSNILTLNNPTATNATLMVINPQLTDSGGLYSVSVSNWFGTTNSTSAVLTVGEAVCDPPPSGLVSWWAAEGNANDSFGTNNGMIEGNLDYTTGEAGQAWQFDGTSTAIHIPASSSLDVGANGGLTIEGWIKPASLTVNEPLAVWNNGTDNLGVHLQLNQPPVWGGNGPGSFFSTISDTVGGAHNIASPANVLSTNNWNHVALTYDRASGMAALYLNGVAVTVANLGSFTPLTSYDFYLGYSPPDPSFGLYYYTGLMDEMSLYNKALSAGQIQAIYNAGSAGKCPVAPAIAGQPSSETAPAGSTVSFSVNATGSQPLSYQWFVNASNLPAATNATLVLTNVPANLSGNLYSVLVTNLEGSTNSSNALLTVLGPGACDPPPSGLVSWWPGEHSGLDIAGTNNGTLIGGVTFTPGEVGQAFNLNGSSAYIHCPASSSLDVGTGPGFTVEAWINPQTLNTVSIVEWNPDNGGFGVHFLINQGSGGTLFANIVDSDGNYHFIQSAGGLFGLNSILHVALTYDKASGIAQLYLNGNSAQTASMGTFTPQTSYDFYLGFRTPPTPGGPYYFNGLLDEVSLYNRALSMTEIQTIYAVGSAGKCKLPVIASQPQSQVDHYGSSIALSVNAGGSGTLAYQWLDNNVPIANATNATLMLSNLQFTNAGAYTVVISNLYGVTISAPAFLTVNPAGVSIALYSGITISGVPGLTYGIQYSTDLSNTNDWVGLANVTLSDTNALWFDLQPASLSRRYYRVVLGPIFIP